MTKKLWFDDDVRTVRRTHISSIVVTVGDSKTIQKCKYFRCVYYMFA